MGINARGLWLCSRQALKHMISQEPQPTHDGRPGNRGTVVNIGSNLGIVSKEGSRTSFSPLALACCASSLIQGTNVVAVAAAYNASKTAIVSLTKSDAIDVRRPRVRTLPEVQELIAYSTPRTTSGSTASVRASSSEYTNREPFARATINITAHP